MTRPKAGVVGVGRFGQNHSRIYSELPQCEFMGIYDINEERGREIAERDNTTLFPSYEALLEAVDFISVVTPTATHFQVASQALEAGKHSLIEKPIAAQTDEADQLITLANARGVNLRVGHLERFNAAFMAATELIDKPDFINCQRLGSWVGRHVTVDVISDLMIHDLDILKILDKSEIKKIRASGDAVVSPFVDHASTWLEFESGTKAFLTADRVNCRRFREITFQEGENLVVVDMMNQSLKQSAVSPTDHPDFSDIVYNDIAIERTEPLKEELMAFLSGDSEIIAQGKDGLEALRLALQILEIIDES